jgi:two-component system response regulator FlrC
VLPEDVMQDYTIISGDSMRPVMDVAKRFAETDASILLQGESGSGKELLARWIHKRSPRKAMPFVIVQCAALTEQKGEITLFGHEANRFVDTSINQRGKIEEAEGGTLFLDEIGEIPLPFQRRIPELLHNGKFCRAGGTSAVQVNIQIIASTTHDLKEAVERNHFPEDLYLRLSMCRLLLPPLRERLRDIPALVDLILTRYAKSAQGSPPRLTPAALRALTQYTWPGNIRELENHIYRAAILCSQNQIEPKDLGLPLGTL